MCGIVGFNWRDEKKIKQITDLIAHRGPDQSGFYFDEKISLGHRRLSILDLSENGRQPMSTADGLYTIVFNGEIFNYLEIKKELEALGCRFKSNSDTEVLLYGYQQYGRGILEKINGQFAFAIYDKNKEEIFLARDRAGINPLYYYFKDGKFIFGSELKVIMGAGIEKEIDRFSLNYYFLYGYTPRERTILKDCYKLLRASFLIFDIRAGKIKEKAKYWELKKEEEIKNEAEAKKLILEQLERSVKARLMADVPVGAFLSGGVDSSAVVAMMSKFTKELNTFSIKFDHADFDESRYAKIVSEKFSTKHHVIEFSAQDVRRLIPKLVFHYDEPFADPSMIATFLVAQVARKQVTVSLSGDGGDELFGGYPSYSVYGTILKQKYLPRFLAVILARLLAPFKIEKLVKIKKFFEIASAPANLKFAKFRSLLSESDFKKIAGDAPEKYYQEYSRGLNDKNYLRQASSIDIDNYLVDNILTKVDRASLGNSLESRPPILDHKMMELAARISPELKIKKGETKYIFKKALEGVLPEEIIYRPKKGFAVPLKYYLRGELKDLVKKYVLDYNKHDLYQKDIVEHIKVLVEKNDWGKDHSRLIWAVMMFNMWHERWIIGDDDK